MASVSVLDVLHLRCCLIWEPYKALERRIESALTCNDVAVLRELPNFIRSHRANFMAILAAPKKCQAHRDLLCKAETDGIHTSENDIKERTKLDRAFINDAIKLSDALDLDELRAGELLLRAELQQSSFEGFPRAPMAAMLFFDGQLALASALSALVRLIARRCPKGLDIEIWDALENVVLDIVFVEDLLGILLQRLKSLNLFNYLDTLRRHELLDVLPKYQNMLVSLIESLEQTLCDVVFNWCVQQPLKCTHTLSLYSLIGLKCMTTDSGYMNQPGVVLLTALVKALSVHSLQQSLPQGTTVQKVASSLSLFQSPSIPGKLVEAINDASIEFKLAPVKNIIRLAISVAVNAVQLFAPGGSVAQELQAVLEELDKITNEAIQGDVFRHLVNLLGPVGCMVHTNDTLMACWHELVTDFIVQQPLRIKRMRLVAEEIGRTSMVYQAQHGVHPPEAPHDFEFLLEFLSLLYQAQDDSVNSPSAVFEGSFPCAFVPDFARGFIEEFWIQEASVSGGHATRVSARHVALYNFVLLYRDYEHALPSNMYMPYCRMLATLSQSPRAASACFSVLRNRLCPSTVCLDHIFGIFHLLHEQLRNVEATVLGTAAPGSGGTTPGTGQAPIQLNAMEIHGLVAALRLVTAVVKNCETARVLLQENPSYNSLMLVVSFLGCSLPMQLKAASIDLLAAFANTAESSLKVWRYIEAAKLVPSTTYVSTYSQPGLQNDLEQVESRAGLYPVTCAFLRLLDVLTDYPLPVVVTSGTSMCRNGFDPYIMYIRESVLLKLLNRTYNSPEERWLVGALCLKIIEKILRKYSCVSDSVLSHESATFVVKPIAEGHGGNQVAFSLLAHLLRDGPFLRLLLKIIDEGIVAVVDKSPIHSALQAHDGEGGVFKKPFAEPVTYNGEQVQLKQCILYSLKILQQALIQQEHFICKVLTPANTSLMVVSLDQLLSVINPRTNRPDYCTTIGRIVGCFDELPRQALAAARILLLLTRTPQMAESIALAFDLAGAASGREAKEVAAADWHGTGTLASAAGGASTAGGAAMAADSSPSGIPGSCELYVSSGPGRAGRLIVGGFVAALNLSVYEEPPPGNENSWSTAQLHTAIAQTIVRIIEQCVGGAHTLVSGSAQPNVGHLLLGFNIKRSLASTTLQRPDANTPRTCLHTILDLLNMAARHPDRLSPTLVELGYRLMYVLCANPLTSQPVLNYLRHNGNNFFVAHLATFLHNTCRRHASCASSLSSDSASTVIKSGQACTELLQQCWLLKGLAIELRMCAEANQRSMLKKIIDLLVVKDGGVETGIQGPLRRKLFSLLDQVVNTVVPEFRAPNLKLFDNEGIKVLLEACQYQEGPKGPTQIDIFALHDCLALEKLSGPTNHSANMPGFNDEIADIVRAAVEENLRRRCLYARKACLLAWREVAEMLVCCWYSSGACSGALSSIPADAGKIETAFPFTDETQMQFLLELSAELLTLISDERKVRDSLPSLSEVMYMSTVALSKLIDQKQTASSCQSNTWSAHTSMTGHTITPSSGAVDVNSHVGQLLDIARSTIDALLHIPATAQLTCSNLYGALLNILSVVKNLSKLLLTSTTNPTTPSTAMDISASNFGVASHTKVTRSVLDLVSSFGEPFKETICRSACEGHHAVRILVLSIMDILFALEHETETAGPRWLDYIAEKGYLSHIVDSLIHDDRKLQLVLRQPGATFAHQQEADKTKYLFGAKMNVLSRVAQSEIGARLLLDSGLINRFTELGSFQLRPAVAPAVFANGPSSSNAIGGTVSGTTNSSNSLFSAAGSATSAQNLLPQHDCYRRVYEPVMQLLCTLWASLRQPHAEYLTQLHNFLVAQSDVLLVVLLQLQLQPQLRTFAHNSSDVSTTGVNDGTLIAEYALAEVTYACKVIGKAHLLPLQSRHLQQQQPQQQQDHPPTSQHFRKHQLGRLRRLQATMLSLLPWAVHLRPTSATLAGSATVAGTSGQTNTVDNVTLETLRLELIESILHSCVDMLMPSVHDRRVCHLMFKPNLLALESPASGPPISNQLRQGVPVGVSPLQLGLLVQALPDQATELQTVAELRKKRLLKLEKITELGSLELFDLLPEEWRVATLDTALQRAIVRSHLTREVETYEKQQSLLVLIIEQTLFVLWRHIEYFLTQYVPCQETSLEKLTRGSGAYRTRGEIGAGSDVSMQVTTEFTDSLASVEDVESLRASVANVFSDTYFRKLLQAETVIDGADASCHKQRLIGPLIRRLKSLTRTGVNNGNSNNNR